MWTFLVSRLLFPLHERLKRHSSVAVRRELERSQWYDAEQLAQLQLVRLRALLSEAAAEVPYYRELFARLHFDPAAVRDVGDLQRLPFLDKATIRAHTEDLKHRAAIGLARFNTGGSSGEPLIFFIGKERISHDVAAKWRATRWWNVDIGDPEVVVWGSPIELGAQDRVKAIRDRLLRTSLMPAFEMSETKLDGFVTSLRKSRPRMLFGYPSALSLIARHAQARGQRLDDLGVRVVFVTSERLYDDQRAQIEQAFAAPVANGYGGRDAGFIAHQCPAGGMHITGEDVIVELVDASGQAVPIGQPGEVVVTHLATRDFPFIRYRTGDIAVWDDRRCSCGRGLPMLKEIQGRSTDFVIAADGTVMHGLALIYVVRDLPGVSKFKIIQHTSAYTEVQLVLEPTFDRATQFPRITTAYRQRLGDQVRIDINEVDQILPEASGKYRYVVSRVSMDPTGVGHA